jgi:hypothetical protein
MGRLSCETASSLIEAVQDSEPVNGLTHSFYRYPARFSPQFARASIKAFSEVGDVVYDPFMGGGTTMIEAQATGRHAVGTDISSLAVFISKVKTTLMTDSDLIEMGEWVARSQFWLKLSQRSSRASEWAELGYQRNINGKTTWRIRKSLELALGKIGKLKSADQSDFIRCVLLRTAQWALDCRIRIPSVREFRLKLSEFFLEMAMGMRQLREATDSLQVSFSSNIEPPKCLHRPVEEISSADIKPSCPPTLILTSPPYPGVHMLYHRWQVGGRRETAAPFWIANCLDGKGESFYTFGGRKERQLATYFKTLRSAYASLARVANERTKLVQLVAFSAPDWQLPRFLEVLDDVGFREIHYPEIANSNDRRLWREVPNRKFYADYQGRAASSREVLLIHALK